jgi:hypothetical protein
MPREGTSWEETVLRDFPMLQPTANSGAVFDDGDARHGRFVVECKDEGGEAIRFPYNQLLKLRRQAAKHRVPHWLRFYQNGNGDRVVSMDYNLARTLLSIVFGKNICPNCEAEFRYDV